MILRQMRCLGLTVFVLACAAIAKPWQGITPGTSLKEDVVRKFGEPSKVSQASGRDVLAYSGTRAIPGTAQAQFRVEPKTLVVERIDVFPSVTVTDEEIEKKYGGECVENAEPADACYQRRTQENKPAYFLYSRLGLAVFFKEDGKTVLSFTFLPAKK